MLRILSLIITLLLIHPIFATTIITLNIANYNDHPNWATRLNLIVDAIEKSKADIVVLQEIRFAPDEPTSKLYYQNTAEQILRKLNEANDFQNAMLVTQPIMFYPIDNHHQYPIPASLAPDKRSNLWEGLSIISKRKILETGSLFLSQPANCYDFNKRATQYVKIENGDTPLYITNVHFGLSAVCAASNISETMNYLKMMQGQLIVLGDFNVTPDYPDLAKLRKAGLVDIWQKLHPNLKGYTFPSNKPTKRLDFIWTNFAAKQIDIIGNNFQGDIYPSDHLGLAMVF